jgi:hypothetical protein
VAPSNSERGPLVWSLGPGPRAIDVSDDGALFAHRVPDADNRFDGSHRFRVVDLASGRTRDVRYGGGVLAFVPGGRRIVAFDEGRERFVLLDEDGGSLATSTSPSAPPANTWQPVPEQETPCTDQN